MVLKNTIVSEGENWEFYPEQVKHISEVSESRLRVWYVEKSHTETSD